MTSRILGGLVAAALSTGLLSPVPAAGAADFTADPSLAAVATDLGLVAAAEETDPSLLVWYKFDESNGATVAADSSGNGRNGTFVRASVFETGKHGGAFQLSGGSSTSTTANYASIPNTVLQGLTDITVSTWVKWDASTTNAQWLYGLGAGNNKYLFTTPRSGSSTSRTAITTATYTAEKGVTSGILPGGVWKHLTTTLNTANGTLTYYIDGVQVGNITGVTTKAADLFDATKSVAGYIGKSFYSPDPYFDGAVDDFKIYNRALTPSEVATESESTAGILGVTLAALKVPAIIDAAAGTVLLPVKPDTDLSAVAPTFTLTAGATISPANGATQNFTNPVVYTVTGAGGATKTWTVTARLMKSPILPGKYADPDIVEYDGVFYIYPTTDGFDLWTGTKFKVFSSTDLVNWTDHGVILDLGPDVSWADGHAWAPSAARKGNKYYFYFVADGNTGVAVADSPLGPFTDSGAPLLAKAKFNNVQQIDPAIFTDTDGTSYLFWGQHAPKYVPLNADMISYDSTKIKTISGLAAFSEGVFVNKRDGIYYLSWSTDDTRSENYRVGYATATSLAGPWTSHGVILQKDLSLGIKGTGHHSIIQVPGTDQWYIVYHRFAMPDGNGYNRETTIDKLEFNADGTIKPVIPTLESISPVTIPVTDTTAPTTIGSVSDADPAVVTLSATDNAGGGGVAKIEYRIAPSTTWLVYTTPVAVTKTAAAQTVEFRAVDQAGNTETTNTAAVPAVPDTSPPTTTVDVAPATLPSGWHTGTVTVTVTAADNVDITPTIQIDVGAGWVGYTAPLTLTHDGDQDVQVRAVDAAGNTSVVKTVTVKIDSTNPVSSADVNDDARIVTLRGADATSGLDLMQFKTGDDDWATYAVPFTVAGTAAATVSYRAIDIAGNVEPTQTVYVPRASTERDDPIVVAAAGGTWTYGTPGDVAVRVGSSLGVPTGTIEIRNGATSLGTATLTSGRATITPSGELPAGEHTLTVVYSGDTAFAGSTDTVQITAAKATSTTTAKLAATTVAYGNSAVIAVKVTAPGVVPTGTVTVKSGTTTIATGMLTAGAVRFTLPHTLSVKTHTLTISYAGTVNIAASATDAKLVVAKATSRTKVKSPPATVNKSAAKKLAVALTANPKIPVTGKLTLTATQRGVRKATAKASVTAGSATITLPALKAAGRYLITISYGGTATVAASSTTFVTTAK